MNHAQAVREAEQQWNAAILRRDVEAELMWNPELAWRRCY